MSASSGSERQSLPPPAFDDRAPDRTADGTEAAPRPEAASTRNDARLREFAEAAFLELDAGELQFSLAEPASAMPSDGPWHTLEPGEPIATPRGAYSLTQPLPSLGERALPGEPASRTEREPDGVEPRTTAPSLSGAPLEGERADSAPEAFAATRLMPPPRTHVPRLSASAGESLARGVHRARAAPSLFDLPPTAMMGLGAAGLLFVRTGESRAFAGRLDAIRAMAGTAATRILHRRTREANTSEVLGGIGSPLVRIAGDVELVLGARPAHELTLLTLEEDLAFIREDRLLGFEMGLGYENGRVSLEPAAEGSRPLADGAAVVQLRGTGTLVVEVAGKLTSLASAPGRPLIVRREWVVGWFGRLVTRALSPADSPTGQRGLVSFAGEGLVLLCSA